MRQFAADAQTTNKATSRDIILCGVGGQGTILASKLIARAAMDRGLPVKTAETIGMAQRGGSVFSHVRVGEGGTSPLIGRGKADLIIAFEPAEAVRQLSFLKPGGTVVACRTPIIPVSAMTGGPAYDVDDVLDALRDRVEHLVLVDATKAEKELGSAKCLNVVLLGAAAHAGALGLTANDVRAAIRELVPQRFWDLNDRAIDYAATV